jgi:hypothetical protein
MWLLMSLFVIAIGWHMTLIVYLSVAIAKRVRGNMICNTCGDRHRLYSSLYATSLLGEGFGLFAPISYFQRKQEHPSYTLI